MKTTILIILLLISVIVVRFTHDINLMLTFGVAAIASAVYLLISINKIVYEDEKPYKK